jgi:hypothetical protein
MLVLKHCYNDGTTALARAMGYKLLVKEALELGV